MYDRHVGPQWKWFRFPKEKKIADGVAVVAVSAVAVGSVQEISRDVVIVLGGPLGESRKSPPVPVDGPMPLPSIVLHSAVSNVEGPLADPIPLGV